MYKCYNGIKLLFKVRFMENEIDKYEDIYKRLKKCFDISFGNGKKPVLIPISEI